MSAVRDLKNECYQCVSHKKVPGNCHIGCGNPDPNMQGDPHGVRNGWFFYPILFDPTWKAKLCSNFVSVAPAGQAEEPPSGTRYQVAKRLESFLKASLGAADNGMDYVGVAMPTQGEDQPFPSDWREQYRWLSCYAVTGTSEGHYVHVDGIDRRWEEVPLTRLFTIKTFGRFEEAWQIAKLCAEFFQA